jgi:hypothetical protein
LRGNGIATLLLGVESVWIATGDIIREAGMSKTAQEGTDMDARTTEQRVDELEKVVNELIHILATAGGELNALPPDVTLEQLRGVLAKHGGRIKSIGRLEHKRRQ